MSSHNLRFILPISITVLILSGLLSCGTPGAEGSDKSLVQWKSPAELEQSKPAKQKINKAQDNKASSIQQDKEEGEKETDPDDEIKHPKKGVRGEDFGWALVDVMEEELDSFMGWRPNDLVLGHIWHNRKYYQLGKLAVVRESVRLLKNDLARIAGMDEINEHLDKAEEHFFNSPTKFWFPSAANVYWAGIEELKTYIDALGTPKSKFDPRSDNLHKVFEEYLDLMGDAHHQLIDENATYFQTDNIYFYSRGMAVALLECYKAINHDFYKTILERDLKKQMDQIIVSLTAAAEMDPLIILDGEADDLRANHRKNLAAYISDVMNNTYTMAEILEK